MNIHQRIKERRLALELKSHKALADLVGVSWQTVQLWEKEGGTAPNRNRINKVAEVLRTTPAWLLHGEQGQAEQGSGATPEMPAPQPQAPAGMQWISSDEYRLLTLFRCTDEAGRDRIMRTAEAMPKILLSGVANYKP